MLPIRRTTLYTVVKNKPVAVLAMKECDRCGVEIHVLFLTTALDADRSKLHDPAFYTPHQKDYPVIIG